MYERYNSIGHRLATEVGGLVIKGLSGLATGTYACPLCSRNITLFVDPQYQPTSLRHVEVAAMFPELRAAFTRHELYPVIGP